MYAEAVREQNLACGEKHQSAGVAGRERGAWRVSGAQSSVGWEATEDGEQGRTCFTRACSRRAVRECGETGRNCQSSPGEERGVWLRSGNHAKKNCQRRTKVAGGHGDLRLTPTATGETKWCQRAPVSHTLRTSVPPMTDFCCLFLRLL